MDISFQLIWVNIQEHNPESHGMSMICFAKSYQIVF